MGKGKRHTPDIRAIAREAVTEAGFEPDFPADVAREVEEIERDAARPSDGDGVRDLRALLWSSIDNKESRDLDQVEYAERTEGGYRVLVGIADVDAYVPRGSAIDRHAAVNTVSVYTPAEVFPMLPLPLSTGITSLLEGEDRLAVVMELALSKDGDVTSKQVYRALVNNRAKMDYESAGAWLEDRGPAPEVVGKVQGLEEQVRLQDEIAQSLHELRRRAGALELERAELVPVVDESGHVIRLDERRSNRAQNIIESLMVAANTSMAELLEDKGVPSLRRVVRAPERWPLIVKTAAALGFQLPDEPDPRALSDFMSRRREADPAGYADLSLSILKMMGPGDYMVEAPGLDQEGHFGLAVHDYTHSTAPNRRFPDLVTQRCLKSAAAGAPAPYTREELEEIAARCNLMESAARKVERRMRKTAAAAMLGDHIGETFDAVVTGVKDHGTFARTLHPPADGRIMRGWRGLDVGDRVRVRLLSTDPERGFIDFARVGH
ncbi:MAG TPA: RNB domain-containing ribonuclease [Pyrinomonadaceae bacterium]|nr:RNB domain-containing ribonuclease [Pyrinomonadaceae bacterium]